MSEDGARFEAALERVLVRGIAGAQGLAGARRLTGGASQETYAVDATLADGTLPLILRRRPGGARDSSTMALTLETEAGLLGLAAKAAVPVPQVRYVLRDDDALGSGYLMERLEGETIPRRILRDERFAEVRPRLAHECGEILARIHAIGQGELPALPVATADVQWQQYRDVYDGFDQPHPVFELAFRWLEERLPEASESTLVHGDFRNGNLLIDESGVRGVLDWEIAHTGDPMEDLGWICVNSWRFGRIDLPVGGFGEREALFAGYESAGGRRVDAERVRLWEVMGTLKWGVMCLMMLGVFDSGVDRSVERAAIGRRASETEIDLLALLAPED